MGLDMYLYRASKTNNFDEAQFQMPAEYADGKDGKYAALVKQIRPFLTKVKHKTALYDTEKIAADYGMSEPVHVSIICGDGRVTFMDAKGRQAEIKGKDIDEKYTRYEVLTYYICKLEEIAYWRKHWDLEEAIEAACSVKVENCGYYHMTRKMMNVVRRIDPTKYNDKLAGIDLSARDIFFHIWY